MKIVNKPDQIVQDALRSLSWRFEVDLENQIVYRPNETKTHKVALIGGGGSGHEPAFVGLLGDEGLAAVVCGNVFASPSSIQVSKAIERVSPNCSGILLVVNNYTGDRIQFGQAMLQASVPIKMLVIDDDCSIPRNESKAGRRGIAGAIFVHKVIGSAAARGLSLDEIYELGTKVVKNVGSMGVAIRDEMELGLGLHGEPGFGKSTILTSKQVANVCFETIMSTKEDRNYMPTFEPQDDYCLLVNNLGSTTGLEVETFLQDCIERGTEVFGKEPARVYSGAFMTSLDMVGLSLSILRVPHEESWWRWLDLWNGKKVGRLLDIPSEKVEKPTETDEQVQRMVEHACKRLMTKREDLNKWDAIAGDGDCGETVYKGAEYVLKHIDELSTGNLSKMFGQLGNMCGKSMGGSFGGILGIVFAVLAKGEGLKDACDMISEIGGARVGDRTMLDVLVEMSKVRDVGSLSGLMDAAKRGAEATSLMEHAHAGRASYLSGNLQGVPDPGSMAIVFALEGIVKNLE
jgi:dihydroxyacetone kinase